jgi:serine/threonine protein kinase
MAKVITEASGVPANDAERRTIGFLRDHLPDTWRLFHNFELRQGPEVFEIDIALLGPHAVYLVDVKGTRGNIDCHGAKWYPEGRAPFHSPLAKLRGHAKALAGLIADSHKGQTELRKAHVQACVLLTADDAGLFDPAGIDGPDVTDFKRCLRYLADRDRIPSTRLADIRRFHGQIAKAITGNARPKQAALVFRDWQVEERLGGTDRYTEYRARHSLLGKRGGMARLRVYQADPYQEADARRDELKKIGNAYRAVAHMPTHANVLAVKDLFVTDGEDRVVLVTEDLPGQALALHIRKAALALTFDQKLQVMRDMLAALDHAHRHEVIHRNLTPDAVLVTRGGQARITGFDFARVGKDRTTTIAGQVIDDLDPAYQAPECYRDPAQASIASDLYAAGLIFYELLTGERPFEGLDQMLEADGRFPMRASEHQPDLPAGMDAWLQTFCAFDPEQRHASAALARKALDALMLPAAGRDSASAAGARPAREQEDAAAEPEDLTNLPQDFILADRFRVQERLGSGGFGVAYKVFDALGDVVRVIKLVTRDRQSVYERLRREYKTLTNLPEHRHVVKVIWADRMADAQQTPYIVFEYVDGLDVSDLIDAEAVSLEDAVRIARETAQGLAHLHAHGVYHQDVKPSNLLWTDGGVRIIDFNVAVAERDEGQRGGGTHRYLPPDYDHALEPDATDRVDRDLYALGLTFYECLTGKYPFDEPTPPLRTPPRDPRQLPGGAVLSGALVGVLLKMIAPERKDRFPNAERLLAALDGVERLREATTTGSGLTAAEVAGTKAVASLGFAPARPNTNPFVTHLLTLYSQSQVSNAGTRGLDEIGKATYVATDLDGRLKPALFRGEFRLVIISGNAGDGKTAFIQQFEADAEARGAQLKRGANGAVFQLDGHGFQSNHDGSQDEGDERNDAVLQKFFAPFAGTDASAWPENQTRLIAINEGRLVDFFLEHEAAFPRLAEQVQQGLAGAAPDHGVAVINLNLRAVVADADDGRRSILERLIGRMTQPAYWQACEGCDLRNRCYAHHNACTFQDPVAGPKVIERLKMLYTITHLRGRLHITMRDLRSALAFMLVGTHDCDGIHQLYQSGGEKAQNRILDGFYFNAWLGGAAGSGDRLVSLLREIDVAEVSNPDLDRELGFLAPATKAMSRFSFAQRPGYDDELMAALFRTLPRDYTARGRVRLIAKHRNYLAHMRRRQFFERRDGGWKEMLPYASIGPFLAAVRDPGDKDAEAVTAILHAVNRGEGLTDPDRLGHQLALRVRHVERGTIRSYRLFDGDRFRLATEQEALDHPFLECLSQALVLAYDAGDGHRARLRITLDMYEMLVRLNRGYRPSIEEQRGFLLSLSVFKNLLASVPYKEVLLTRAGRRFYEIRRQDDGVLAMKVSEKGAAYHVD